MSEQHQPFAFDFTSRYGAGPMPNPLTMCPGQCDGTGFYPVFRIAANVTPGDVHPVDTRVALTEGEVAAWEQAHRRCSFLGRVRVAFNVVCLWRYGLYNHYREVTTRCDGWHFIRCPECSGTGVRRLS